MQIVLDRVPSYDSNEQASEVVNSALWRVRRCRMNSSHGFDEEEFGLG